MYYDSAFYELFNLLYSVFVYKEKAKYTYYIPVILDTIAEIAVPVAAILLIVWLLRHWKK